MVNLQTWRLLFVVASVALWTHHRYLRKVDCSRCISWLKILFKRQALVATTTKQPGPTALPAYLLHRVPATRACSLKLIFVVAPNRTNKTKKDNKCMILISLFFDVMSMETTYFTSLKGVLQHNVLFGGMNISCLTWAMVEYYQRSNYLKCLWMAHI